MFSEKNAEIAARQAVEREVALTASIMSARFVDNLFESYKPHNENIMWHMKSVTAKIAQFDSFTRVERNSASGTLFCSDAITNVANPKQMITKPMSNNFRALNRNRRLTSLNVRSLFAGF